MHRLALALLVLAACKEGADVDIDTDEDTGSETETETETDTETEGAPRIDLTGTWSVVPGDELPWQVQSWCDDLRPEDFDTDECWANVVQCWQELRFDADGSVVWQIEFDARDCETNMVPERHEMTKTLGAWDWVANYADDGDSWDVLDLRWDCKDIDGDYLLCGSETLVTNWRLYQP